MQIIVERTENPARSFCIWDEKITNKSEGRIYPSTTSNVGSGISVAVFQIDENENRTRIAQLELPDYEKLHEYYSTGKKINLDYTYIDDFSWLGEKKPYEVEGLSYTEREGFLARCSFFNNQGKESYLHLMQSIIKTDCLDFSYTAFFNLNLNLCNLTIEHGNVIFDHAHLYNSYISLSTIMCGGIQLFSPEICIVIIHQAADTDDQVIFVAECINALRVRDHSHLVFPQIIDEQCGLGPMAAKPG